MPPLNKLPVLESQDLVAFVWFSYGPPVPVQVCVVCAECARDKDDWTVQHIPVSDQVIGLCQWCEDEETLMDDYD